MTSLLNVDRKGTSPVDQHVIDTHEDVESAMYREDVGDIDFVWGKEGKGEKFKGGYGLAHIIAKRDAENGSGRKTADKLVEVIAKGNITGRQDGIGNTGEPRLKLGFDDYTVVLSMKKDTNVWLLTGFENNKKAVTNANGEGFDSSVATATTPTLTRRDRAVTVFSNSNISQEAKNVKGKQKAEVRFTATFVTRGRSFFDNFLLFKNIDKEHKYRNVNWIKNIRIY